MNDARVEVSVGFLNMLTEAEAKRYVRNLVQSLFQYDEQRDTYKLKNPDITEYSSAALSRMAGLK